MNTRKDPRTLAAFLRDFVLSRRAMRSNDETILTIYPRLTPDGSERLDLENEDLITAANLLESLVVDNENMRAGYIATKTPPTMEPVDVDDHGECGCQICRARENDEPGV